MKLRLPRLTKLALVLVFIFVGAGTASIFSSTSAYALDKPEDIVNKDVESWLYYRGLRDTCVGENFKTILSRDDVLSGQWFESGDVDYGYLTYDLGDEGDDKTIDISCEDGSAVDRFADQIMGFDDEIEMLCVYNDKLGGDAIVPEAGDAHCEDSDSWTVNRLDDSFDWGSAFTSTLDEAPYRRPLYDLTSNKRDLQDKKIPGYNAWRYWIGKRSVEVMCGKSVALSNGLTDRSSDSGSVVSVDIVDYATGKITESANYELTSDRLDEGDEDGTKFKARFDGGEHQELSCGDMAERTRSYSQHFSKYTIDYYSYTVADNFKDQFEVTSQLKKELCGDPPRGDGSDLPTPQQRAYGICIGQISTRFDAAVDQCRASELDGKPMSVQDRISKMKKCLRQKLPNAYDDSITRISDPNFQDQDDDATNDDDSETSCAIDGVGWIVCPLMNFLADLNDKAFGVLTNFLQIEDDLTTNASLRAAWSTFRDMANVAFVIAFLIIIYSQITGAGVTNYGIKRLLPKMIIAAVLVNSSLILCQIAVDLSNIVGSTIYNLLTNLANADSASTNAAGGWTEVVGFLLAGAVGVGLLIAIILAPTALLAIGAAVLILIARKAIILLLIVVAPLAFVAYLLPNTEDWFKKWWKMFSTLLMLFPVIGLIFGASSLAAGIINNVAGDADGQHLLQLTALGIMAVPLFAVPVVLKGALSAAGSVGQRLSGWQDKANRRGMRGMKESRLGEAKTAFDARRQSRKLDRRVGKGVLGRVNKRIDSSRVGRYLGGDRGAAAATAAVFHEFDEEVKRQKTLLSGRSNEKLIEDLREGKGSEEYQAAVAGTVMSRDHRDSHLAALKVMGQKAREAEASGDEKAKETISSIQKQMAYDMKDKPWALGDQATGQLQNGTYGYSESHTGEPQRQFGDINEELKERVGTKLSAQSLAGMNPDEMRAIYQMATGTHASGVRLDQSQIINLKAKIGDLRVSRYKDDVKPEAKTWHDDILKMP